MSLTLLSKIDHGGIDGTVPHTTLDLFHAEAIVEPNESGRMRQTVWRDTVALDASTFEVMIDTASDRSGI